MAWLTQGSGGSRLSSDVRPGGSLCCLATAAWHGKLSRALSVLPSFSLCLSPSALSFPLSLPARHPPQMWKGLPIQFALSYGLSCEGGGEGIKRDELLTLLHAAFKGQVYLTGGHYVLNINNFLCLFCIKLFVNDSFVMNTASLGFHFI